MMRYVLFLALSLSLASCSKQVSVCMDLGENANVHGEFGYFYDSATVDLNGPAKFRRLAKDQPTDPCTPITP